MRVLHLTDRWSGRGGAYTCLGGLVEEQRRAGLEIALAAGARDSPAVAGLHLVQGLASRGRAAFDLGPLMSDFRPDVVHVHTVVNPEVLEWAARRTSVITVQDHRYFCPTRGKWTLAGQPCRDAMRADLCGGCFEDAGYFREVHALTEARLVAVRRMRVVALSRYMAGELVTAGVPVDVVTVVPPFVHGLAAEPADGPPCVALVGRLTDAKGVRDAVRAWRSSGVDLPLVAVGTGPLRRWLEEQGIPVTGWLDRAALARMWGRTRALVLAPRWQEPFGIAGLEGVALGIRVAAWESGGIAEWHPGPLARWGDVDGLAERLREAVRAGPLPEQERRRVRERFDPRDATARLLRVYGRAVGLP